MNIAAWFLLGILTVIAVAVIMLVIDHRYQRAAREAMFGWRTTSSHGLAMTTTPRQRGDLPGIVTRRFYGEREIERTGTRS